MALRNLCEANRRDLAAHIGAFGELHAGLDRIPVRLSKWFFFSVLVIHCLQDSEKSKVLQSIASVIQAMPPIDEIPVIEVLFLFLKSILRFFF